MKKLDRSAQTNYWCDFLRWKLEDTGLVVLRSNSLEQSFLVANPEVPSLVIVDVDVRPDELWPAN